MLLKALHPGALAVAQQLKQDYDFDGIQLVLPTTVFEERHVLDLDGTEVHLIYVGPCHQIGDTLIHMPKESCVRRRRDLPRMHSDGLERHLGNSQKISSCKFSCDRL